MSGRYTSRTSAAGRIADAADVLQGGLVEMSGRDAASSAQCCPIARPHTARRVSSAHRLHRRLVLLVPLPPRDSPVRQETTSPAAEAGGTVPPMCGIVGYVGPRDAPRRRGRGSAPSGVSRLRLGGRCHCGRRDDVVAKKAGKIGNLEKPPAEEQLPRSRASVSVTPAGPRTVDRPTSMPTRTSPTGRIALVHNGIIENFVDAAGRARGGRCRCSAPRPTPRSWPSCWAGRSAGAPLAEAMRTVCGRLAGAFTLVAVDARAGPVVAARRNSPLVVGVGEGENFVASDVVRLHRAHPAKPSSWAKTNSSTITAGRVVITTFEGKPAEVRPYHVDWDLVCRGKGWLRLVHAQGDLRAAASGR